MNALTTIENTAVAQIEKPFPLTPLSDIIVIKQHLEEKSKGGIILMGGERKYPCGRVVAVGPGRVYSAVMDASGDNQLGYLEPMRVKVGDWCVFGKYQSGGEPIEIEGERYLLCRQNDLAGISSDGQPIFIKNAPPEE